MTRHSTAAWAKSRRFSAKIQDFFARITNIISRPVTSIVLGVCFGIAFWSIPFFIVANYQMRPEAMMVIMLGLVGVFGAYGSILSIILFILGFILGILLLYSTSPSSSY
jgi:hypothetical protein